MYIIFLVGSISNQTVPPAILIQIKWIMVLNIKIYGFVYHGNFLSVRQSDDFSEKFHERMYASVTNEHLSI